MRDIGVKRSDNRIEELVGFLQRTNIGCLATAGADGLACIAIIFFVYADGNVYYKSRTASAHSVNLSRAPHASMAIFDPNSTYKTKYGAQLKGRVTRIRDVDYMNKVVGL